MNSDKNIMLLSTADWKMPYLTNKQHMAKTFARNGYKVLYVESLGLRNPSLTSSQDWRRMFKRLLLGLILIRKVENNIWVCSPVQIPNLLQSNFIRILNELLLGLTIRLCLFLLAMKTFMLWSYHAYCRPVLHIRGISHTIYHCVDDLSAVPGINLERYRQAEKIFSTQCDAIFVTHKNLLNLFAGNKNVYYQPNVVDVEHFRAGLLQDKP